MDLVDSLRLLAEQNRSGVAFLTAYGATWIVCGLIWLRAKARTAAFATLFQGMVAFPIALGLSALIGAIGADRPVEDAITQLSVLIGTSQLLGLPFLVYLIVRHYYALVPIAFSGITSIHFVLYSWLYQTPIYIVMAALISIGGVVVMLTASREPVSAQASLPSPLQHRAPILVCFLTGGLLFATTMLFLVLQLS